MPTTRGHIVKFVFDLSCSMYQKVIQYVANDKSGFIKIITPGKRNLSCDKFDKENKDGLLLF